MKQNITIFKIYNDYFGYDTVPDNEILLFLKENVLDCTILDISVEILKQYNNYIGIDGIKSKEIKEFIVWLDHKFITDFLKYCQIEIEEMKFPNSFDTFLESKTNSNTVNKYLLNFIDWSKEELNLDIIETDVVKNYLHTYYPEWCSKGTGAGGKQTNLNGLKFEDMTLFKNCKMIQWNNEIFLNTKINLFTYTIDGKKICTMDKKETHKFLKFHLDNQPFDKYPDEIIYLQTENVPILVIIEKKSQNTEGSVIEKLWTGPEVKKYYQYRFRNLKVEYCYTVNNFIKEKLEKGRDKDLYLLNRLYEERIPVFYGEEKNYYEKLFLWIMSL